MTKRASRKADGSPYTLMDCLLYLRRYPPKHFSPVVTMVHDGWHLGFRITPDEA